MIKPLLVAGLIGGASVLAIAEQRRRVWRAAEEPPYHVEGSLVSVIIPALEEEDYLENLLISINHQTYEPIESIVVDQSPLDSYVDTRGLCGQYGAKLIYNSLQNVAAARNEGARAAMGKILVFSDADNILASTCVEELVKALQEGYVAANPVQCLYDYNGIATLGVLWGRNWFKPRAATTGCIAIWRDAYFAIGGYREDCDPLYGCREDLQLGKDIVARFGGDSIKLVRGALVGTSGRRYRKQPLLAPRPWEERVVRATVL